jgi:hypothetical protein
MLLLIGRLGWNIPTLYASVVAACISPPESLALADRIVFFLWALFDSHENRRLATNKYRGTGTQLHGLFLVRPIIELPAPC